MLERLAKHWNHRRTSREERRLQSTLGSRDAEIVDLKRQLAEAKEKLEIAESLSRIKDAQITELATAHALSVQRWKTATERLSGTPDEIAP